MRYLVWLCLLIGPGWAQSPQKVQLAGRQLAIWQPQPAGRAPLVLFSHGFHGSNTQSAPLMRCLARAGYLVVAPNHQDCHLNANLSDAPQQSFEQPKLWTDQTYRDRAEDLAEVYRALAADPYYGERFDPKRLVLMGHSLGGYTVVGLSGAWPAWASYGLNPLATVCLSPYTSPFVDHGRLDQLRGPVMYQGGIQDTSVTVARLSGTYERSCRPKIMVVFEGADHHAWTGPEKEQEKLIESYTLEFLNHYLTGKPPAALLCHPLPGVADLRNEL